MEDNVIDQGNRFLADRPVTESELATHKTYAAGLWTSLGGIVYDITNFSHPGGSVILNVGGIQGDTLYMRAFNNGNHPYTMAQVVLRPNVVRIGPSQNDPVTTKAPTAPTTKSPTKAPAILGPSKKPATRAPTKRRRPTKRPTRRPVTPTTGEVENESPSDEFD